MKIKTKIIVLTVSGTVAMALGVLALVSVKKDSCRSVLVESTKELATEQCKIIAKDLYRTLEIQHEAVQSKVASDLRVAADLLQRAGEIKQSSEPVRWTAVNQQTKESREIQLPKFMIGGTWLGTNRLPSIESPIVDDVQKLVGGTCTIFQRINEQGDMLRVSTNVITSDQKRAVGTYIPATEPDGTANEVIATVLSGKTFYGRAYVVDDWYLTAYEPIHDATGDVVGILYVGQKQEDVPRLRQAILDTVVGETGYVYVFQGKGKQRGEYIISHQGTRDGENVWDAVDADGRPFIQNVINNAIAAKAGECSIEQYPWKNEGELEARQKVAACVYFEPWDWVVGASVYEDDFDSAIAVIDELLFSMIAWAAGAVFILALAVTAVAVYVANNITRPISKMTESLRGISNGRGDLTQRIEVLSNDETGEMATCFNRFLEHMQGMIRQMAGNASQFSAASSQLSVTANDLASGASATTNKSESVANAARDMTQQMNNAASSAEQMSANANTVSAAVEEMTASISEIARSTEQASNIAHNATDLAEQSKSTISHLGKAASEIGNVIEMIQEIAEQTNLLALNATIEAARAGDAGKGFAVVATEVKQLAKQTADATQDIRSRIGSIQTASGDAVKSVNAICEVISEVSRVSNTIASAVEEQSLVTKQISQNVRETSAAVEVVSSGLSRTATYSTEISSSIACVDEAARSTAVGATQTRDAGQELAKLANELQTLVDQFEV